MLLRYGWTTRRSYALKAASPDANSDARGRRRARRDGAALCAALREPDFHARAWHDNHSARESPAGKLPAFCRVAAELRPTADSEIKIEVWLPPPDVWNGKYEAAGNGGWGGSLNNRGMSAALSRGYATSSTDTGHTGGRASFAMGHPQKLIDFGYRSVHLMTLAAKQMIAAFYGRGPKLSYFEGCSSGGRQALMEAQRFPEDYDGIIAGAPTNNWTRMMFGRIWVAQATLSDPAAYINPSQYPMIHRAALAACDALDGVKDEVLENPTHCHFDPGSLACKDAAGPGCLTKPQIEAARRIYTPATDPLRGRKFFRQWNAGASWYGKRWPAARSPFCSRTIISGTSRPFFARGGKLIQYHGWTDQQVMPRNSIHYYESVAALSGKARRTIRTASLWRPE